MHKVFREGAALSILLAGCVALTAPAAADTTVAEYVKMDKREQAHVLGTMLQSLGEDLQNHDRDREVACLQALYTPQSEARAVRPPGMQDLLQSVEIAREGDPEKVTLEEIIARQMIQYCGTGRKK